MNIIKLDWETYYDKDYSLKKMTTEEYVRDPRFEAIGLSVKHNDNRTHWVPRPMIQRALDMVNWDDVGILCHNTAFDGFIMSQHYGIVPKFYFDTMSMARPWHHYNIGVSLAALVNHYRLGTKGTEVVHAIGKRYADFTPDELEAYGRYCCNDTELTGLLFQELLKKTTKRELLIIDRTIRMFCDPKLVLNTELLESYLAEVQQKREEILAEVAQIAPEDTLMSNDKLAVLLEAMGVEVPMKLSVKKTATRGYDVYAPAFAKTDKAFAALLEHPDDRVANIVAARLGVKSSAEETRAQRLLDISKRGLMPVALQYWAAGPGRWGGADKQNLQNLRTTRRGGNNTLRRSLTAPPGYVIVAIDSSNIELRVNHMLAGQEDTIQALREKRDLYCEFATDLYEKPITKADTRERFMGKTSHLSLGYQSGAPKFREACRIEGVIIDEAESERVVSMYRNKMSKVKMMWWTCQKALTAIAAGEVMDIGTGGLVQTGFECLKLAPDNYIMYPGLQKAESGEWFYIVRGQKKYLYGGKMVENICQSLARHIVAEQLLIISKRYPVVLTVHDEVVYLAPDDEAKEALAFGVKVMSTSPTWWPDIPLAAEGEVGKTYS